MKKHMLYAPEISDLLIKDLKGLCITCVSADTCSFRTQTNKEVIQCEFYHRDYELDTNGAPLSGLCRTCDKSETCKLSGRISGVWHCDEYV